jgi:hypothetical protein
MRSVTTNDVKKFVPSYNSNMAAMRIPNSHALYVRPCSHCSLLVRRTYYPSYGQSFKYSQTDGTEAKLAKYRDNWERSQASISPPLAQEPLLPRDSLYIVTPSLIYRIIGIVPFHYCQLS